MNICHSGFILQDSYSVRNHFLDNGNGFLAQKIIIWIMEALPLPFRQWGMEALPRKSFLANGNGYIAENDFLANESIPIGKMN